MNYDPNTIAVIGVGPRGLSILERIITYSMKNKHLSLNVLLFDPGVPGCGCHLKLQPDHLLVNTVASQMTLFSDGSVENIASTITGPSFYEWLTDQKKQDLPSISPNGYYSRSRLGEYLHWVYLYLLEIAPENLSIKFINDEVIKTIHSEIDGQWDIIIHNEKYKSDYLFITTGHGLDDNNIFSIECDVNRNVISNPYPIEKKLENVAEKKTVGIEGMGLTFFDIISHLTTGRKGMFQRSSVDNRLLYIPSGKEPKIIAYSRSGLPLSSRAINQKNISEQHQSIFFTLDKINRLKKKGKIDFEADLLPLLISDMEYVYYDAYFREKYGYIVAQKFCNGYKFSNIEVCKQLINSYVPNEEQFSWYKLSNPITSDALKSRSNFKIWLNMYLRKDIYEARKGNLNSPVKAACDVLRDLRDNIRAAVDFDGLTEESQQWFTMHFLPVMNRLAVGPPVTRTEEMLALMEAGILKCDLGPGAICNIESNSEIKMVSTLWGDYHKANVLVKAKVSMPDAKEQPSRLFQSLFKYRNARLCNSLLGKSNTIEIDHDFHLVNNRGQSIVNSWVLGVPTEGQKFYTFIMPRPGVNSTFIVDSDQAVKNMFSTVLLSHEKNNIQEVS